MGETHQVSKASTALKVVRYSWRSRETLPSIVQGGQPTPAKHVWQLLGGTRFADETLDLGGISGQADRE